MKKKHNLKCVKRHLEIAGNEALARRRSTDFGQGRGDGLLRALDLLNGRITGDATYIAAGECICKKKLWPHYDHYEEIK